MTLPPPLTTDATKVQLPAGLLLHHKLRMFLGHYDLRVMLTDRSWVDVDRGSFDACLVVKNTIDGFQGCVGTVGQFCTFATGSELFGGGEHWNDLPVNIVFNSVPMFAGRAGAIASLNPKPQVPFAVGHGVVVSAHARVLSGATVGDGAVVAAGAVVAGQLPAFTICGGIPARPIRPRFDPQAVQVVRWWDFDTLYMANNLARLQELAVDTSAAHIYRKPHPRLVIRFNVERNELAAGIVVEGLHRPIHEAPQRVQDYIRQIAGPGPDYVWLADVWN